MIADFWQGWSVSRKTFDEELGRILAGHRRSLDMSQEFFSSCLGRDQTYVSKVETGKRAITLQEFLRWCDALNLDDAAVMELSAKMKSHVE